MSLLLTQNLNQLETLLNLSELQNDESEKILIISEVSWSIYEQWLNILGNKSQFRVTYLEGMLQIMSPSRRHESYKKLLEMLLEAYLFEAEIRFYPLGSTTFRSQLVLRGIEPDQCYCFNSNKSIPDLAIEIVISSGGINSLNIYKGLEVPEVWFWEKGVLSIYCLENKQYKKITISQLLPNLDLSLLASYVESHEPFDAVMDFRLQVRKSLKES